ncbi:ferredoxin [Streptomyces sp. NPDC046831]|uniref:ferredoxin n=1 Tax=Streptomyces sp. NPDC046831 TaxID=3154805 RepID=UPI0033E7826B
MRITADSDRCLGAGQCVLSAPDRFDQSEEGTVLVLDARVADEADETRLRETVSLCPSQAIALLADDSPTANAAPGGTTGPDGATNAGPDGADRTVGTVADAAPAGPGGAGAHATGAADAGNAATGEGDRAVGAAGAGGAGAHATGIAGARSVGKGG